MDYLTNAATFIDHLESETRICGRAGYDSFRWRRQREALESFRANLSTALTTHSQSLSLHFASSGTNASWTFFAPCRRIKARSCCSI